MFPGRPGLRKSRISQVGANARAVQRAEEKIVDARLRLIRELERLAYSDVRDLIQWDTEPTFDREGNLNGERPILKVTPARLLTRDQAAQVRSVTTKTGSVKFEMNNKLDAHPDQ